MPSIIPGWVYSIFAALIVGAIIVYSCSLASMNIKNQATNQQLTNIDEYLATQCLTVISHTQVNNQNTTQFLDFPSQVGNQRFWIRIASDSSGAWVESGFGAAAASTSQPKMNIPAQVVASGTYVSGQGRPELQCHFENQTATLTLTSE